MITIHICYSYGCWLVSKKPSIKTLWAKCINNCIWNQLFGFGAWWFQAVLTSIQNNRVYKVCWIKNHSLTKNARDDFFPSVTCNVHYCSQINLNPLSFVWKCRRPGLLQLWLKDSIFRKPGLIPAKKQLWALDTFLSHLTKYVFTVRFFCFALLSAKWY